MCDGEKNENMIDGSEDRQQVTSKINTRKSVEGVSELFTTGYI